MSKKKNLPTPPEPLVSVLGRRFPGLMTDDAVIVLENIAGNSSTRTSDPILLVSIDVRLHVGTPKTPENAFGILQPGGEYCHLEIGDCEEIISAVSQKLLTANTIQEKIAFVLAIPGLSHPHFGKCVLAIAPVGLDIKKINKEYRLCILRAGADCHPYRLRLLAKKNRPPTKEEKVLASA